MVTLLRGAQAGDAEAFTCLYAVTNPLLVRYLRVVSDADPATLAVDSWSTLLDGISACDAGDDDDWLELAVSTAREHALTAAGLGAAVAAAPDRADQVDEAVAALRACGPEVAEVLAMGVAAGLGRDSIARITGHEPTEVLALVLAGQDRLGRPLAALSAAFGAPATAAEVRDLPVVLPLFAAQAHQPLSPATTSAASPAFALLAGGASAVGSAGSASAGSPSARGASAAVVRRRSAALGVSPRLARVGTGAAAWTVAVGGVAAAAAMIGVAPAAFDSLFGHGRGGQGIVAAHGPVRPGALPSPTPGALGTTAPGSGQQTGQTGQTGGRGRLAQPGQQAGPQGAGAAGTGTSETTGTPSISDALVSTSTVGLSNATQVVVVSAVLTGSTPAAPGPVTAPGGIPTTPAPAPSGPSPAPSGSPPAPPSSGNAGTGGGTTMVATAVKAAGPAHPKHSTGLAKGRAKAAQAAAARARAKEAAAKARAAAAAARAKTKSAAAAAKSTA